MELFKILNLQYLYYRTCLCGFAHSAVTSSPADPVGGDERVCSCAVTAQKKCDICRRVIFARLF